MDSRKESVLDSIRLYLHHRQRLLGGRLSLVIALSCVTGAGLMGCPPTTGGGPTIANSTCLACHDGRSGTDQRSFHSGAHAALDCEACHGDGYLHVRNGGRSGLFIDNPERRPFLQSMNDCARCHQDKLAGHMQTKHGTSGEVSCHACHDVHKPNGMTAGTSAPQQFTKQDYAQLCGQCHFVEVDTFMKSAHANFSPMSCGTCHDMHIPTTYPVSHINNQLCQQCHGSFAFGLDSPQRVDFHTGEFHPVDPAGTGASRCTGCHMPPVQQGPRAPVDHLMLTVPPLFTNQEVARGISPPPPNSCSGVAGCHDPGVPTSGQPHNPNDLNQNAALQPLYETTGGILP
jgi:hypothetical protein